MLDLPLCSLGEIASFVNGDRSSNYPSERDFVAVGVPFISATDLAEGGIDLRGAKRITRAAYHRLRSGKTERGDILFCLRGSLGKIGLVEGESEAAIASSLVIIRAKFGTDPRYLYYVLQGPGVQALMGALDNGSVQPNLSVREIAKIEVPSLGFSEQRAVADILGALDDKIELNRRMSETLEAMARALFKSWFVDFDPVRAKAEGRDTGLPREIADLFPDSLEESDLGEIPMGWPLMSLGDLLELAYGKALKADQRADGAVPVYGSNGQVGWHDEALVRGPGIIVGRKGNPGVVTWSATDFFPIDTTFYVVPKLRARSMHFLLHALRTQDLGNLSADSAVPGLNRNLAYMSRQVVPPTKLLETFERTVAPLAHRVHLADVESRTLAALRDTLLPKLISGELRVRDAERLVEQAI